MIRTRYHVEVEMPAAVNHRVTESQEYERRTLKATHGSVEAGMNRYLHVEEWAIFDDRADAVRCERLLLDIAKDYAGR